jgi:hypothetical protein
MAEVLALSEEDRLALVQEFMGARYQEGYTKGIHDLDGAKIFHALLSAHLALQLARYQPAARGCAVAWWHRFCPPETRTLWQARLRSFGERNKLFPGDPSQVNYIAALQQLLGAFIEETRLHPRSLAKDAGEYLFHELVSGDTFVVSQEADRLAAGFTQHLVTKGRDDEFQQGREALKEHPAGELELVRDWVRGFLLTRSSRREEAHSEKSEMDQSLLTSAATGEGMRHLDEVAALIFCGDDLRRAVVSAATSQQLEGLRGSHALITGSSYRFDYLDFRERLGRFEREVVPRYEEYHRLKQELLERERRKLRLDEFKPRVLSSFVRNQLIDRVYLQLVGDNLAKQIGAAGDAKRTDLMGLLLLISPPGYGKTTLMEYLASRLGIIFVKVNGPAIGHHVTSLDPQEAPNAAAREEVTKLNLALEMGDNVLICLDDIQHCSPEFLQKFISLCDGQRKIEGVWRGQPRTYDLRGRKVVVVMAGNPYTESGTKFKIPDMLANRADTYNLGDIIGGSAEWFKASYLENAVTSNAVLAPLANKSQKDIRSFIRMAESGERDAEGFEGSYSQQEVEEILGVMKKLVAIREVILKVNLEYIASAAQADEFRTEPPFKLQGSYRNMNRLAEKVVPIMNDEEVRALVIDHYRGESQTLTTGAEANLLKFKELIGAQTGDEKARWEEIRKTFKRNQLVRGGDQNDPVSRVVSQLSGFQAGLESIQETLATQLSKPQPAPQVNIDLAPVNENLAALKDALKTAGTGAKAPRVSLDLGPLGESLKGIQSALEGRSAKTAAAAPPVQIDLSPLTQSVEALRATVEQKLASTAQPPPPAAPKEDGEAAKLAQQLTAGLQELRDGLTAALGEVQSGVLSRRLETLNEDVTAMYNTLETLKDMAREQSINLRAAQDLLTARAKQGTVEIELTQDMLTNERLFLEKFHELLADREKRQVPPPSTAEKKAPPPLPDSPKKPKK